MSAGLSKVYAQTGEESPVPVLLDEYGMVGECDFGGRLDTFLAELSQKPDHQGYIINYKSAAELLDERDSFAREKAMTNHIAFRNFDSSRITIVRGGYRSEYSTELWLIPPGAEPPPPSRTVPEPRIQDESTFLFAKTALLDMDAEQLQGFVIASIREQEAAEHAEALREMEAEQGLDDKSEASILGDEDLAAESKISELGGDRPEADSDGTKGNNETDYIDERSEEDKEAERFEWADVGLGRFLTTRKKASGVMIFYADDERYDISKIRSFIEKGRDRLAEQAQVSGTKLSIVFGGYREYPEVEFWFVPTKGKAPAASPEERPVEAAEPEN